MASYRRGGSGLGSESEGRFHDMTELTNGSIDLTILYAFFFFFFFFFFYLIFFIN
jgi:hypothetical protein